MSRKLYFVVSTMATIMLGGIGSRADAPPVDLKKDNAELRQEVQRLRGEIDALKAQLAAADKANADQQLKEVEGLRRRLRSMQPLTTQPTTVEPPSPKNLPPGTVEQQFNGSPVYLIPLGAK